MSCIPQVPVAPWLRRIDPRTCLIAALVAAAVIATVQQVAALALASVFVLGLAVAAQVPAQILFRRYLLVAAFSVVLVLILPLVMTGAPAFTFAGLKFSQAGFSIAARIIVRLMLIITLVTALLGSIPAARVSLALAALRLPQALVFLFSFTVRYASLMRFEYARVFRAMKMRGFSPGWSLHAIRGYAGAVGMVLVRSFDRAERIQQAMELRGFDGRFHTTSELNFGRRDVLFIAIAAAALAGVIIAEAGWHQ